MKYHLLHDALEHETMLNGKPIYLTKIEHKLMSALQDGRVHSRPDLLTLVWAAAPDMRTRTVDMHMSRLKNKLGRGRVLIRTLHGIGYQLISGEAGRARARAEVLADRRAFASRLLDLSVVTSTSTYTED